MTALLMLAACGKADADAANASVPMSPWTVPISMPEIPIEITPALIDEAVAMMRTDPLVLASVGEDWEVIGPLDPVGEGAGVVGMAFVIRTPRPVSLPAGLPINKGTGEQHTGPVEFTLTDEASPPNSYFSVFVFGDMSVRLVRRFPDLFGDRRRAELEVTST